MITFTKYACCIDSIHTFTYSIYCTVGLYTNDAFYIGDTIINVHFTYVNIRTRTYVHCTSYNVRLSLYICMCACVCVCVFIRVCVRICAYLCLYACKSFAYSFIMNSCNVQCTYTEYVVH